VVNRECALGNRQLRITGEMKKSNII